MDTHSKEPKTALLSMTSDHPSLRCVTLKRNLGGSEYAPSRGLVSMASVDNPSILGVIR